MVEKRLVEWAITSLAEDALNAQHYKEGIVAALTDLATDAPYHDRVLEAAHTLGQTLLLANEEQPREVSDLIAEGISAGEVEREETKDGIHTIAVPRGWTIEQTWETISRGEGVPAEGEMDWVVLQVKDGKYKVIPAEVLEEFDTEE